MPKIIEGQLSASGLRLGIVVARFNELITRSLLSGALDAVARHGGDAENVVVAWVPGAFEVPWWRKRWPHPGSTTPSCALAA